ncbi:MAG: HAMP domain-containing protein [Nitrospirae bacterium]|nr:HAMP domain-containing protein [Nitrospirota bacterium]
MFRHIRTKFVIILLITGLLPLLIGTVIYLTTSKRERIEEREHALIQELSHVTFAIETIFLKARTNLLLAAENPAFFRYPTEPKRRDEWGDEQIKTLRQLQLLFPEAISVTAFTDVAGKEITKVVVKQIVKKEQLSSIMEKPFYVPGLSQPPNGVYQGEPYLNPETRHWVIPFIAPVFDRGNIMGLLYFDLNLEYFSQKLKGDLSPDNYAFLLERSGKILAQTIISIGESEGLPNVADLDQSLFFHEILKDVLEGNTGVKMFTTSMGRRYIVTFQSLPSSLWSVMVLTPFAERFKDLIPIDQFFLIFMVTFILIIIFTFIIGKRFSDPVRNVVTGTQIIASGDFTYRIKIILNDELGELARSFNKMAEYLQKTYQDIKSTNAQLTQSAKLAAVGELAAGVAHELNQPLMVIRGHAQELLDGNSIPEAVRKDIKLIEKQTGRMMRIIDHLRAFARQSSGTFEQVNLNSVLNDSFTLVTQQLKNHNIEIVKEFDETIPKIWGDHNRLEQVFLNLITNARDAMEEKGEGILTVQTRSVFNSKEEGKEALSGIRVILSDTGTGIEDNIMDKIFDPFFTTKEVGKGTGLGLSIGYSIIKEHGGTINVESRVGTGTRFTLEFPAERRKIPREKNKRSEKTLSREGE